MDVVWRWRATTSKGEAVEMFVERRIVPETGDEVISFRGQVSEYEMSLLNVDRIDRSLLDQCGKSDDPADWLLVLEMLFRKRTKPPKNEGDEH